MTLWCLWSHFCLSSLINDTLFPGFYIILYFYPRNITVDVYDVYCPGSPTIKHLKNLEFVPKSSFIFCNDYRCFLDLFYQITSNFIHDVKKNNKLCKSKLICIDKVFKISVSNCRWCWGYFSRAGKNERVTWILTRFRRHVL